MFESLAYQPYPAWRETTLSNSVQVECTEDKVGMLEHVSYIWSNLLYPPQLCTVVQALHNTVTTMYVRIYCMSVADSMYYCLHKSLSAALPRAGATGKVLT